MPHDATTLVSEIKRWLEANFKPGEVAFCIIYGSVAHGTATAKSDIDTLLVTRHREASDRLVDLRRAYATFQAINGFEPDMEYPLEVWSLAECSALVAQLKTVNGNAIGEWYNDALEIVHALTDRNLVAVPGRNLVTLKAEASAVKDCLPEGVYPWSKRL